MLKNVTVCYFVYIFIQIQSAHTHSKISKKNYHDYNLINVSLRWYVYHHVCWEDLPDVITFVFYLNPQICHNGWSGADPLVLISPHTSHAICFGLARGLGYFLTWLLIGWWGIDLLPPKYSTNIQIQTLQLSEKLFIAQITTMLITRWHK